MIIVFFILMWLGTRGVEATDPQYIFVRKDNTCANCILWNGNNPGNYNAAAIDEIINKIGTRGTATRRLGVGALFEPNLVDMERTKSSLTNLLTVSLAKDFPVYLSLDNFNWWEGRPDLWNWWDPNKPGYNPRNRMNVEWTDWDGATNDANVEKLSWTNWGIQFRRPPSPNLLSPTYLSISKSNLSQLLPIVVDWYNKLPADKKYLLGGVDFGNELDVGGNYYFYRNGNSYLDKDPINDPNSETFLAETVQTGFAAVKAGGFKTSGIITTDDLNRVVSVYVDELNKLAYEAGVPRNKIFNHTGGKGAAPDWIYPNYPVFSDLRSSLVASANPGWSFYGDRADNPQNNDLLIGAVDKLGKTEWGAPEWLTYVENYDGWVQALRNTLNYRNNRLINAANWDSFKGIRDKSYAMAAIRDVLNEGNNCWVTAPIMNSITVKGKIVNMTWVKGEKNEGVFLHVSNSPEFNVGGLLKNVNVVNDSVTNVNSYSKTVNSDGKYYWTLIADGCGNQRKVSYGNFTVEPIATPVPPTQVPPTQIPPTQIPPTQIPPTQIPPTEVPPTQIPAVPGDYDGNRVVDKNDFETWKAEFLLGKSTKDKFEIWKAEYLKK